MQAVRYATIRRRQGTGLLPPNNKQWNVEHHALDLREKLGVDFLVPLDHLAYLNHFRNEGAARWSGMAIPVGPEAELVIYNDAHAPTRVRATLMEEFFHIRFDHPRSTIRLFSTDGRNRTMDPTAEVEAYHTGAAALVPFVALKARVGDGQSVRDIARYFEVSPELVEFRAKVTKLYRRLPKRRRSRRLAKS
jgi:hypothetical protein